MLVLTVLKRSLDYDVDYVERIQAALRQHSPSARLVCLSDVPVPCERAELAPGHVGWWNKLQLFAHDWGEPALYVDLDTIVLGDVAPLFMAIEPDKLTMLDDFFRPTWPASGVMGWHGDFTWLWRKYAANPLYWKNKHDRWPDLGDGGFIGTSVKDHLRFQELLGSGPIQSHKVAGNRAEAILGCYHGRPRPRATGWAWEGLPAAKNRGSVSRDSQSPSERATRDRILAEKLQSRRRHSVSRDRVR